MGAETTYSSTTIKKSGSNTIKADAISWGLFSSQDMESTMERVFQSGGFKLFLEIILKIHPGVYFQLMHLREIIVLEMIYHQELNLTLLEHVKI